MSLHVHIHIIKNGGTSTKKIIAENYPKTTVLDYLLGGRTTKDEIPKSPNSSSEDVLTLVSEVRLKQNILTCLSANLPYGIDALIERPVDYFTIVRNPISRFVSYYYALHRVNTPTLPDAPNQFDIEHAVHIDPFNRVDFCNDQLRMVTGSNSLNIGAEDFEYACKLVETSRIIVGILEHYENSIHYIGTKLGWTKFNIPHLNAAPQKISQDTLSDELIERISSFNYWDIEFYHWIKMRLHKLGVI